MPTPNAGTTVDAPPAAVLLAHAQALLRQATELATRHGRDAVARELGAQRDGAADAAIRVVLCGETGRGKSTLANALLDRPGLLPAERDVPTAVHVLVRQRQAGEPEGGRVHTADGELLDVPLDEVAEYVLEPVARDRRVRFVEVLLDHPLLAHGLGLLDSPGVGGLQRAHGRIARAALAGADAAIMVVDSAEKLNAMELAFLGTAVETVDAVVVAFNKIDLNPGWSTVLAEDVALIAGAPAAGTEPPVLPVSARMKSRGDRLMGRDADAAYGEELARDSGVPELRERLIAWSAHRSGALGAARMCRLALSGLAASRRPDEAIIAAGEGDADAQAERARAAREARQRLVDAQRGMARRVQNARQMLGYELDAAINRRFAELGLGFGHRLAGGRDDDLQEDLEAALSAAVDGVLADVQQRFEAAVGELAEALREHGAELDLDARELPALVRPPLTMAEATGGERPVGYLGLVARAGSAAGATLLHPFFGVPMLAGLLLETGFRRKQAKGQQLALQINETIARARAESVFALREVLLGLQERLADGFDAALRQRIADLDEVTRAYDAHSRSSREQRRRAVAEAGTRLQEVQALERHAAAVRHAALTAVAGRLGGGAPS